MHNEAAKALRVHGTKLFIDAPQERERSASQNDENDAGEIDFFEAEASSFSVNNQPLPQSVKLAVRNILTHSSPIFFSINDILSLTNIFLLCYLMSLFESN